MRVGVVGAGWVTQYHLAAWAQMPGAKVVAICDPRLEAAAARASEFGIPSHFDSLESMLEATSVDVLDVCSPRQFHGRHVREGARRGIAVICQKPLGVDLADATALVEEIDGRVPLMVHENWRFRPYYRRLREWLDEGVTGEIVAVRLDFHSSGMIAGPDGRRPALVRQPFLSSLARMMVMEILIHHLDTLRFLFGEMELLRSYLRRSNNEILGEDSATLSLRRRSDDTPIELFGNLAVHGAPATPSDQLWVFGRDGTVHLDGSTLRLFGPEVREEAFDPTQAYQAAYGGVIAHFVGQLGNGGAFETSPHDNLETLRLVEAAYALGGFRPAKQV